jgi:hypothetical protein
VTDKKKNVSMIAQLSDQLFVEVRKMLETAIFHIEGYW